MALPRGSGYVMGLVIGTGSWVVWAMVLDNLVMGFLFAVMTGLLVFGPMFERASAGETSPEQLGTVRSLLVVAVLIGVVLVVVLLLRLALIA
jgi:glucose dehydrogenase